MTMIVINAFRGEIPRAEMHLLPDTAASYAYNCDMRSGSLRALAGVSPVSAISAAVNSLYTEDGITFMTWPTQDVDAHKSLVIGDMYQRMYYTDGTRYNVAQSVFATASGGPPAAYFWAGVPPPIAFSLNRIDNATAWPDGVSISAKFFWESAGVKYQETDVSLAQQGADVGRKYRFTPPTKSVSDQSSLTMSVSGYGVDFNQPVLFESNESITIISATEIQTETAGVVTAVYVLVNNARIDDPNAVPADQVRSVSALWAAAQSSAAGKTPTDALPQLKIVGKNNTETLFTLYSDGSAFVRSDQPAKVSLSPVTGSTEIEASIEWGGNGLIGTSIALKQSAYVATTVNIWGEESKPSAPLIVKTDYLQTALFNVTVDRTGLYLPTDRVRVYETITGASETAYHLAKEYALSGNATVTVAVGNSLSSVGPTLETLGWDLPPATVSGLQALPFGSYAMFHNNELWFTEPYRPHTTPSKYVMAFPNNIKAIKSTAFGLIVVTTAQGYLVSGVSPDSMNMTALPVRASIVSKRAITAQGGAAWYASEDGLVTVQGTSATLEPWQQLFTREKWRSIYGAALANLVLAAHDGFIVGLFPTGDGFLFRTDEDQGEFVRINISGRCAFVLPQTDGLYIGTDTGIVQFAAGQNMPVTWSSKEFTTPKPVSFSAIEICGSGSITAAISGDGVSSVVVINADRRGKAVRLPAGWKAQRWRVLLSLQDSSYVTSVRIAETPSEFANV